MAKCNNKKCKDWDKNYDENCSGLGIRYDGHLCSKYIPQKEYFQLGTDVNQSGETACFGCGCMDALTMFAPRNESGKMVGWVFACGDCHNKLANKNLKIELVG